MRHTVSLRRCRCAGYILIEALAAFAILATVTVLVLANMRRMDENLARVRCEAHLGMVATQYSQLFRDVPWDALSAAANNPNSSGFIRFGGGRQGAGEIPYRVDVQYTGPTQLQPSQQTAQIVVQVFWSPPAPTDGQSDVAPITAGSEKLFRRVEIDRTRF